MRDLIELESHHTFGRAMLADLTRRDVPSSSAAPAEPVDGTSCGPVAQVHARSGDGYGRVPQPGFPTPFDHAFATISAVYDAALAIVRAVPPMPLESPDPWCEDDDPQEPIPAMLEAAKLLRRLRSGLPGPRLVRVRDGEG